MNKYIIITITIITRTFDYYYYCYYDYYDYYYYYYCSSSTHGRTLRHTWWKFKPSVTLIPVCKGSGLVLD